MPSVGQVPAPFDHYRDPEPRDIRAMINPSDPLGGPALKYTPPGGSVEVSLDTVRDRAQLQVKDSGPGIPPADLPRIFDRFYRANKARTGEGSGLGLAIAKWIVEAHGGQLRADNTMPHGAIFTAMLPTTRAKAAS